MVGASVFGSNDTESCTISYLMQMLTVSMQTGLRPIMDPENATVVICSTGKILIRSLIPIFSIVS